MENAMLVCNKCQGAIDDEAKFCPSCGDPVTDADKPMSTPVVSQVADVKIAFGKSSSTGYTKALAICQKLPTYKESGEDKTLTHEITLPMTELELLINIWESIGSLKSSQLTINGKSATKKDLVYHGPGCYLKRRQAYDKKQYCFGENEWGFNFWGCIRMNLSIGALFPEYGDREFGSLDNKGVWHIDKDRIKHDLELAIHENTLCPILNPAHIMETLAAMPNSIDPKKDKNWEYATEYMMAANGDGKEVAVGVKPVMKKMNYYVIGDYKPVWKQ